MHISKRCCSKLSLLLSLLFLLACSSTDSLRDTAQVEELKPQATNDFERITWKTSDDIEEKEDGSEVYLTSPDLDITNDNNAPSRGQQKIGLRFTGIDVPQGATITEAWLQFTVDEATSVDTVVGVRAIDQDNAPLFSTSTNITGASKTSAKVNWSIPAWNTVGASGTAQRTPDLKAIVQEIVNRSGWTSGNAIAFVLANGYGERVAESRDSGENVAPQLYVAYDAPSTPAPEETCLGGTQGTYVDVGDRAFDEEQTFENGNYRIDARNATFMPGTENGGKPEKALLAKNVNGFCISGGTYKIDLDDDAPWDDYHSGGFFNIDNTNDSLVPSISTAPIVEGITILLSGDAVRFKEATNGWTLRNSYIRHAGDDGVENDWKYDGLIDDVLIDWTYQGISCKTGGDNDDPATRALNPAGTLTIQDSLIALKRQEGTYARYVGRDEPANHANLFKWEKPGTDAEGSNGQWRCGLKLKDTVLYVTEIRDIFKSLSRDDIEECTNVTLVYPGMDTYDKELYAPGNFQCIALIQGEDGIDFWEDARDDWFDRNPSFEDYRDDEPFGAAPTGR